MQAKQSAPSQAVEQSNPAQQTQRYILPQQAKTSHLGRVTGLGCVAVLALQGMAIILAILTPVVLLGMGGFALVQGCCKASAATTTQHVYRTMDILLSKPGGPDDWPAYSPTDLTLPANSLVTLTIRNYDLGDTPLPAASPYAIVQGTVGDPTMDGQPYGALDPNNVSHTFTAPGLHLSVPIPGDAASGADFVTVTFTFRTGAAGVYMWQCFDPCGEGPEGYNGPMQKMGFMMGNLIVQG